jgi:hypothetical protein
MVWVTSTISVIVVVTGFCDTATVLWVLDTITFGHKFIVAVLVLVGIGWTDLEDCLVVHSTIVVVPTSVAETKSAADSRSPRNLREIIFSE